MAKKAVQKVPELMVIGAGWGRTGTNSTKLALEKLLGGPCYHMFENGIKKDFRRWLDAYAGNPDWDAIFTHHDGKQFYKATLDYPACGLYRELMEKYPKAKVLLNVRDPEKWYDSVIDTIWSPECPEQNWSVRIFQEGRDFQAQARAFHKATMLPGVERTDREGSIKSFKAWIEKVKETVPPERLLVFDVKEGWEPLCKFLEVPVPDEPFPNVNDKDEIKASFKKLLRFTYAANALLFAWCVGMLVLFGWVARKFMV
ncbi:unnamed protein product [Symbiodinium necroappetens]|uniref:Sulfotransferase domain-containing protein n=1 Tax=Symbiodinium necroappetens TaxID=1628268 RepID=A0A812WQY7_9DINO|nr:unnamed protein product [Symbiodinium necroappetens]